MKTFNIVVSVVVWLFSVNTSYAAFVSPIQADFGDVLPSYSASVDVFKANAPASYVSFNLLTTGDIFLEVQALPGGGFGFSPAFIPTALRLTTLNGVDVQVGTSTAVTVTSLQAGHYALEVIGTGNREFWGPGHQDADLEDFNVQLQVSPPTSVPLPASIWLYGSAMAVLAGFSKVRRNGLA